MPGEDLPLYTIKPIGPRFQLRGQELTNGIWFMTGKAAVKYARESLEKERGCRVEVYAPDDVAFKVFVVAGNRGKPIYCFSAIYRCSARYFTTPITTRFP